MAYKIIDNYSGRQAATFEYLMDAAKFFLVSYGQFRIEPADKESYEWMQERSPEILQTAFDSIRKPTVWAQ